MTSPLRIAIIGAGGYTGAELVRLLRAHPAARIAGLYASSGGSASGGEASIADLFPALRPGSGPGEPVLPWHERTPAELSRNGVDAAFLCTPHEVSAELAPALHDAGVVVIDLSGAFRLPDAGVYPSIYGFSHARPQLLAQAVYALPELHRDAIAGAALLACPGCYPTASILALAPLVEAGAIALGTRPVIDAVSGVSGAGRRATRGTHFCEVSLQPYNVTGHRHRPEIAHFAGTPVVFVPHLAAFDRGILATIHADLAPGWSAEAVGETLAAAYADEPFVRLMPAGVWPSVAAVRHQNVCDIGWALDGGHLILVSAIDNLLKGASGQAVQAMNARFGLPETLGLAANADRHPVSRSGA